MGSESRIHDDDTDDEGPKGKLRIAVEMDKLGMGFAQIEIMILAGGVFMTEGCLLVIASVIVRTLEVRWGNSLYHSMLLAVAMFVGVSFGCMAGGLSADQHGRRPAILICYAGTLVMLPINAAAMHWLFLFCGNVVIGFFFGYGIPAAQSLIAETCPSNQRQNLVCMSAIMFAVGQMAAGVVVWLVNPYLEYEDVNWRVMMLLSAAPLLVVAPVAYLRLPESPMWLFVSAENARAYEVLRLIGHRNGIVYERTGTSEVSQTSPLVTPKGVESDTEAEPLGTWKERARTLFGSKYKWVTIQLMLICFSGNLCYYGLIYILPETFSEMMLMMEDETGGEDGATLLACSQPHVVGSVRSSGCAPCDLVVEQRQEKNVPRDLVCRCVHQLHLSGCCLPTQDARDCPYVAVGIFGETFRRVRLHIVLPFRS